MRGIDHTGAVRRRVRRFRESNEQLTRGDKLQKTDVKPLMEVEHLIKHKIIDGKDHYLVKWQGLDEPEWRLGIQIPSHFYDQTIELRRASLKHAIVLRSYDPAAGRKQITTSCPLDLSRLGSLRNIRAFAPESVLWQRLEQRWRCYEVSDLGEDLFCEFDFWDTDAENCQKRHVSFWTRKLSPYFKNSIACDCCRIDSNRPSLR